MCFGAQCAWCETLYSVISLFYIHSHFPSIHCHLSAGITKQQPLRTLIQENATVCSVTELILFFSPYFLCPPPQTNVRALCFTTSSMLPVTVCLVRSGGYTALHVSHTLIGFDLNDDSDYTVHKALTFMLWVVKFHLTECGSYSRHISFWSGINVKLVWRRKSPGSVVYVTAHCTAL